MKNNTTELIFILDKSGSMAGLEADTIGGFNAMVEKQKKLEGEVLVSTILFSNESTVIHDRQRIQDIPPLTEREYTVSGGTALMDAVGGAIHHIRSIHKYARPEDVPAHTIFVITTDGMENASHRTTAEEVRREIRRQEESCGWEFLFLAANIDAAETAASLGIRRERSANYRATEAGTRALYACVESAVSCMRGGVALAPGWAEELEKN